VKAILEQYKLNFTEQLIVLSAVSDIPLLIVHDPFMTKKLDELSKEIRAKAVLKQPIFGRFDSYQPIFKQVSMSPKQLSEFELIYVLRDIPEISRDTEEAEFLLNNQLNYDSKQLNADIEEARKLKPVLNKEAKQAITDFYVEVRNKPDVADDLVKPIPVTSSQILTMKKLTEAFAKIRFSNEANKEDAVNAIGVMKGMLSSVGFEC
jgi:replicative DNA helicase Mcm